MATPVHGGNYLRIVGAGALVSLAFFFGSLDPFLRAAPITATAVSDRTPPVSVNRYRKGDRLPLSKSSENSGPTAASHMIWSDLRGLNGSQAREKVPVGCDPAFSPVASPSLATVYGRCMT
ncbi:MAG: hypothetical protein WB760_12770 [Xanthobacteraceae bacterium]